MKSFKVATVYNDKIETVYNIHSTVKDTSHKIEMKFDDICRNLGFFEKGMNQKFNLIDNGDGVTISLNKRFINLKYHELEELEVLLIINRNLFNKSKCKFKILENLC